MGSFLPCWSILLYALSKLHGGCLSYRPSMWISDVRVILLVVMCNLFLAIPFHGSHKGWMYGWLIRDCTIKMKELLKGFNQHVILFYEVINILS